MAVWEWIIAYIAGFTLLQFLVYRYLRGSDRGLVERMRGNPDPEHTAPVAIEPPGSDTPQWGETTRPCPHCGTPNEGDATFTYCRRCVRPMSR